MYPLFPGGFWNIALYTVFWALPAHYWNAVTSLLSDIFFLMTPVSVTVLLYLSSELVGSRKNVLVLALLGPQALVELLDSFLHVIYFKLLLCKHRVHPNNHTCSICQQKNIPCILSRRARYPLVSPADVQSLHSSLDDQRFELNVNTCFLGKSNECNLPDLQTSTALSGFFFVFLLWSIICSHQLKVTWTASNRRHIKSL